MASVTATAASSSNRPRQVIAMLPSTPHLPSSTEQFQASLSPSPAARETTASQSFTQDWSGSLLFDAGPTTSRSPAHGGGESGVGVSSASLYPSSSVFETTPDLLSSGGVEGPTTEGWLGGGDVVTTTMVDRHSVQQTTVLPTPAASSAVSPMPSVIPTSGDTPGSGFGESLKDVLIVAVPVGVTVLILLIILIVLCVRCCCRKEKKGVRVEKGEEGWKEGGGLQVAVVPMTVLPTCQSTQPSATVTTAASLAEDGDAVAVSPPQDSRLLYTAVYEFPGQLDSQLTLTPGDVIEVEAAADHGWLRGVIRGDNRSGWFPSSFVVPLCEDGDTGHPAAETTAATAATTAAAADSGRAEEGGRPCVSSFLLRKKPSKRPPQLDTVPRLTDLHSQVSLHKQCGPVGSAAVTPVSPVRLRDSNPLHTEQFSASVKDKYYKALFAYKAAYRGELTLRKGEVVVGKERDRNGWMLGRSLQSGREGWFPSVYVDQVTKDLTSTSRTERDDRSVMTSSNVSRDVYTVLDVNRNKSQDQAWVAIEHKVTRQYDAQADSHMALHVGDVVAVVQALECGWCLGCQGDRLGWFPADHVELLEEKSEGKMDSFSLLLLPLCRASLPGPQTPPGSSHDLPSSPLDLSQDSILGERPRPARTAPRPPLQASQHLQGSVGNLSTASTQSANPRPVRPAPAPPSTSSARCDSVSSAGSMDRLEGAGAGRPGGRSMSLSVPAAAMKQRKPRVVRIAKERLGLDKLSSFPLPRPPSVASPCPSPPLLPPSGAHNSFFLRTAEADTPRHSPPSSAAPAEGQLDSEVADTKDDLQQSESVPAHTVQDEVKGKERLLGETSPPEDGDDGGNEDGAAHHADTETCEGPSGGRNPGDQAASPSATSIAVQTDIPDPSKDDSHDFRPPESDSRTTTTSTPTPDPQPREDEDGMRDDAEEGARGGDSTSGSEDVTYDPDSSSSVRDGHTDSGSDEDIPTAGHAPQRRQSPPPAADSADPPAEADPAPTRTSPPVSKPTPKATRPLPDLLHGTKVPPQPVPPKPTSPCSGDLRPRASRGSEDLRPKEEGARTSASVRPAPVVCPLSQKEVEGEVGEEGLVLPPEGVSGRVSMIVSLINRMASVEEEDHHRKPSLPLSSWPADVVEESGPDALKDAGVPAPRSPPPGSETRGSSPQEGGETGWSARGSRASASHQNGVGQGARASQQADRDLQAGPPPAGLHQETAADPGSESRRSSRPQSGKGARVAPPPPTSPPPPHTRKSQRLKSGRKKAVET